jgi:hypothetical protein
MSDILSGLAGGVRALLVGWIFPSIITVALFAFLVLPSLNDLPVLKDIVGLSPATQTLVLGFLAVALAVILSALQTQLYRLLEGYAWPRALRQSLIEKRRDEKRQLEREADRTSGLERALLLERYRRYPVDDDQVAPTRLANGIRAFETYAFNRFRLDSQLLWDELMSSAPESVQTNVDTARTPVDFFVSLVYLFAILGVVSIGAALRGEDWLRLVVVGAVALALVPVWYRLAVVATDQWSSSVKALVNLGRKPLAEALGLEIPKDLERERQMWRRVNQFVRAEFDPRIVELMNEFRSGPDAAGNGDNLNLGSLVDQLKEIAIVVDSARARQSEQQAKLPASSAVPPDSAPSQSPDVPEHPEDSDEGA